METFTNGMILPREAPTSTTIVRRPILSPQEETDEKSCLYAERLHDHKRNTIGERIVFVFM